MVKLILVRHALTVDNQKSRLSGHIDSSISEEGKEQIDKITNYLKDFDIDKIQGIFITHEHSDNIF